MKTISEEKQKEFLHNADHKSLSLENSKNNKNSKLCHNLQDRNVHKNQPNVTNTKSPRKLGTGIIFGDSIVNGINEKRLSKKHGNVKFFTFQEQKLKMSISTK